MSTEIAVPEPEDRPNVFHFGAHPVRQIEINGEPWFVAKDVCDILDLSNPTEALRSLDDDERAALSIPGVSSNGTVQRRSTNAVNEPGLYALIFKSRKPAAKHFARWVTHDVLPAIHKTGGYGVAQAGNSASFDSAVAALAEATKAVTEVARSVATLADRINAGYPSFSAPAKPAALPAPESTFKVPTIKEPMAISKAAKLAGVKRPRKIIGVLIGEGYLHGDGPMRCKPTFKPEARRHITCYEFAGRDDGRTYTAQAKPGKLDWLRDIAEAAGMELVK